MGEQRERDWPRAMWNAARFHEACPWCQTWAATDCLDGRGCPTPDGLNGEMLRPMIAAIVEDVAND